MEKISISITEQNRKKLNNHVQNWAVGEYKDNVSAFINYLIERYIPEDPSL